ncbi:MAG: hypothetical protein AVDCRST_MAG70-1114 [uncultured Thermomicrobiales bacterium]|uniref:Uncharacterized protein n=1 Tax=uncultured Thermomicrobiales bacterium TaxID=1645740 RepID=A0A6J4UMN2_9BACT|nr:MAG: hypothetical protein AVDCRST_MAG70-1114 [uncultured Thermomicrobiales bacterium]
MSGPAGQDGGWTMAGRRGTISPVLGGAAPDATVVGADGGRRSLRERSETAHRATVMVFVRQFGRMLCREQAT